MLKKYARYLRIYTMTTTMDSSPPRPINEDIFATCAEYFEHADVRTSLKRLGVDSNELVMSVHNYFVANKLPFDKQTVVSICKSCVDGIEMDRN